MKQGKAKQGEEKQVHSFVIFSIDRISWYCWKTGRRFRFLLKALDLGWIFFYIAPPLHGLLNVNSDCAGWLHWQQYWTGINWVKLVWFLISNFISVILINLANGRSNSPLTLGKVAGLFEWIGCKGRVRLFILSWNSWFYCIIPNSIVAWLDEGMLGSINRQHHRLHLRW